MRLLSILITLTCIDVVHSIIKLRGSSNATLANTPNDQQRNLAPSYYYTTTDTKILGAASHDIAIGNPLKGLLTSPDWTGGNTPNDIPSSLEFYYIGLDRIMTGSNQFDWSVLDKTLRDATSRNNHVIWRVICHYPGEPLKVPQYLINAGIKLVTLADGSSSPQYDDPILQEALKQFIAAFGKRYDGNKSIGFIQLGLLGYWGEWHTSPDTNLLSTEAMNKVVGWYDAAFQKTQLQVRIPLQSAYAAGMGLHDDSFAFSTLGTIDWFFMPLVEKAGQTTFWKKGAMGGETRPELQEIIFESTYRPGSDPYKQDFTKCVDATHATYMFHHAAFKGQMRFAELANARKAHARLGYNFQITSVAAATQSKSFVILDVTVKQTGVAPFYYPLDLVASCSGTTVKVGGVESLIESGESKVFTFKDVPSNAACLDKVSFTLESEYVYVGKPIKFAQGNNGTVALKMPLPGKSSSGGIIGKLIKPLIKPFKKG